MTYEILIIPSNNRSCMHLQNSCTTALGSVNISAVYYSNHMLNKIILYYIININYLSSILMLTNPLTL